jgi:hypothetical protein
MSETKELVLANEQLRRSNRRWKTLALAACSALILMAVVGFVAAMTAQMRLNHEMTAQMRLNHELRAANAALASANQARVDAPSVANPGQPR